jgi:putative transposase
MHRDLVDEGHEVGRHRASRLMRGNQLIARQKRRFKRTTDSEHAWRVAPNLVAQDFTADGPDRKRRAGISCILTTEGWFYLAVVLDLFSRPSPWASNQWRSHGSIHHSDRGSQYCSVDYQALLRKRGILIPMSGRGNCCDNSMVETFFKTIKSKLIWTVAWKSRQQAENAVARYVDGLYNPARWHSSLDFQSPIAFERKAREVS